MPSTLAREACHQPELNVSRRTTRENGLSRGIGVRVGLLFAALFVIAIFVWQGIAAHGAPDPLRAHTTATVASLDIGVLVFREGLECILAHNRRRKSLLDAATSNSRLRWGLILLGFTSLYREGFEVVLFLQSYHLRLGGAVVLKGTLLGLVLTGMVALLTFVLQQRLPYRKMLITTGILLGVVLLVMVGEQAQEMQLANWISATPIPWLTNSIPAWVSLWFAVFPTYETMAAQFLAALIVVGSYYAAKRFGGVPLGGTDSVEEAKRVSVDTGIVKPLQAVR